MPSDGGMLVLVKKEFRKVLMEYIKRIWQLRNSVSLDMFFWYQKNWDWQILKNIC